ncbi:hypothetical protein [Streptomyces griseosporeus]
MTEPRPVTDAEREEAAIALRIVTDIGRLFDLRNEGGGRRIRITRDTLQVAQDLYVQVEQIAHRSRDADLLAMVAQTRCPDPWV